MFPNGLSGFMTAVSLLMFSVCGATWLCDSGERIQNPEKNIIRGNVANTATACLLFALITIVSSGVLPVEQVANQPLTNVAEYVFPGKWYLFFIIGGAIMAICTTVNGRFLGAANMLRRSALEGWYPEALAKINKNDTPWVLLIGVYLLSVLPILLGVPLGVFASLMALFGTVTFLVSNLSFFALIKHYPEEWKNSRWHMPKGAVIVMSVVSNGILVVYMIANLATYTSSIPTLVVAAVLCAAFVLARKKTVLRKAAESGKQP